MMDDAGHVLARLAFAVVLYRSAFPQRLPVHGGALYPSGLAALVPTSWANAVNARYQYARVAAAVLLVAYVSGTALQVVTPLLALLSAIVGSIRNSQGSITHSKQVLTTILAAQAIAYGRQALFADDAGGEALAFSLSRVAIVSAYLTAAISKVVRSKGRWWFDVRHVHLQIAKTNAQAFVNTSRGDWNGAVANAEWWGTRPLALRVALLLAIAIELGSPLALTGQTAAVVVGVLLIALHVGTRRVLKIRFSEHIHVIAIYLLDAPRRSVESAGLAAALWKV